MSVSASPLKTESYSYCFVCTYVLVAGESSLKLCVLDVCLDTGYLAREAAYVW